MCPLCFILGELHLHLFLYYPVVARVRQYVLSWLGFVKLPTCVLVVDHLKAFRDLMKGMLKNLSLGNGLWLLPKEFVRCWKD